MTFANKISGNGTISIDSGTVALTGNNYAFSGYIDVASGAVAVISEDKNIGRADWMLMANCKSMPIKIGYLITIFKVEALLK